MSEIFLFLELLMRETSGFLLNHPSLFPCFLIQWAWYSLSNTHLESESLDMGGYAHKRLAQE